MNRIWWFTPCLSDEPGLDRLGRHCRFTIGDETTRAQPGADDFASSNFPTGRLELTLETFSLDCFYWVDSLSLHPYMFVSKDLRDAMALGPRDVQYLPVDASLSAPLPRSKNYMIMHVPTVETVSDPDESTYLNKGEAEGSEKPISPVCIAIREDADPKHEVFRDSFFSAFVFCTDKLAVRILEGHFSGVGFVDPWYMSDPLRFRSLCGIEEEIWDTAHEASNIVSSDRRIIEADCVGDHDPHNGGDGIYADYGDQIRGVQFAAVPMPLGSVGIVRATPGNRSKSANLADGSVRFGTGESITAARLLNAVDRGGDRDAVRSTLTKFRLNPEWAADVLAARAYVWANNFAPRNFADVPISGPDLESVSASIMQVELARPGTLCLALQGDWLSTTYIKMAAEEGLCDTMAAGSWMRDAHVPAALRSTRTSARAALDL